MSKISIISPCFNADAYIIQTYQSIRNQTHENWEWVVTDDQSTDESIRLLKEIAKVDERVKLLFHENNQGAAKARNNSLNHSHGEYIAFLDIDDLWENSKLEKQLKFMRDRNLEISHHNYKTIDADGNFIKYIITPDTVTSSSILKFNPFATSSLMIKRSLIEENKIRFKEHLRRRQDYIFWYDALDKCEASFCLKEVLSSYRIFGKESLSSNKKQMAIIQWQLLRDEFDLNIIQRIYYFISYALHGLKKYFF